MLTRTARNTILPGERPAVEQHRISGELDGQRKTDILSVLTEREHAVLTLMAEGRSNQAISDSLFVNSKTVETYVHRVFTKLGLMPASEDNRRVLAVLKYLSSGGGRPDGHRPDPV